MRSRPRLASPPLLNLNPPPLEFSRERCRPLSLARLTNSDPRCLLFVGFGFGGLSDDHASAGATRSGMLKAMDERSRDLLSSILGSAIGGVVGYLYLTETGRKVREQIEPSLDAVVNELQRARDTGAKVREVVREGQRTLNDLVGEDRERADWESVAYRQASK